jgi:hypothetical protein
MEDIGQLGQKDLFYKVELSSFVGDQLMFVDFRGYLYPMN